MLKRIIIIILGLFVLSYGYARQKVALAEVLPGHTTHFKLSDEHEIMGEARRILSTEIAKHQFVGLGELHNSQQLGYFTKALIPLLAEAQFEHMALEMGHYQVASLERMSKGANGLTESIRKANQTYGSKLLVVSPLVFADRVEDAAFLEEAVAQGLNLHGFDQEHLFSFEMQFDSLFALALEKTNELKSLHKKATGQIRKWNRKSAIKPRFKMACSLMSDETVGAFLQKVNQSPKAADQIKTIETSWKIYCAIESGKNSNQSRANLMKNRFDQLLSSCIENGSQPKVFLKFGSIHMTKGTSLYGVNDIGKHVQETANKTGGGFLNIRHLKRYRNGKDLIGKKGWKSSTNFMKMGNKADWALIDLRPLRSLLGKGLLTCTKSEAFEINNYDFIIVSPDDQQARKNF